MKSKLLKLARLIEHGKHQTKRENMSAERSFEIAVDTGCVVRTSTGWQFDGTTFPDTDGGRVACGVAVSLNAGEDCEKAQTDMKYKIWIKSGGSWRNFHDGSVRVFESRRLAEQVISNWMIDGEVVEDQ